MAEKSLDYYRRILDEDRYEAPLTDSQEGEIAGIKSYNEMVPSVNKTMKSGEPLRKKLSPEAEAQALADREAYDRMMRERYMGRSPQSVDKPNFIEEILAPSASPNEIPLMTPMAQPQSTISSAYIPKLSEISTQNRGANVATPRAPTTAPSIISQEAVADKLVDSEVDRPAFHNDSHGIVRRTAPQTTIPA